jgi:hypothetical protein
MRSFQTLVVITCAAVGTAACATGGASRPRSPSGPITSAEIAALGPATVMDAVRVLRPAWMARIVSAYVDDREVSLDDLQVEPSEGVHEIRLLSAAEATARFGVLNRSSTAAYLWIRRSG